MLRVSKLADYATVIVGTLVEKKIHMNAKQIAMETKLSLPTVSKLLKIMTKSNLLISNKGTTGGYQLAKAPEAITVLDVLMAVEGPFAITECSHSKGECMLEPYCSISRNWKIINRAIIQTLSQITLLDLTHPSRLIKELHKPRMVTKEGQYHGKSSI